MWPNQYPFKSCHDQEQSGLMYLDLNRAALSPFVTRSLIIVLTSLPAGVSQKYSCSEFYIRMLASTRYHETAARSLLCC